MAKKSVGGRGNLFGGSPKTRMSNVLAGDRTGRDNRNFSSTVFSGGRLQNPGYGMPVTRMGAYAKPGQGKGLIGGRGVTGTITAANYGGVLPSNRGKGIIGGRGVTGTPTAANYGGVLKRVASAPKVTASAVAPAPIKAQVKPTTTKATTSKAARNVVRATTNMKPSPTGGRGLGVSTGTRTGSSATRMGTSGKTSMSASQRAQQNAFNKGGVAGPSRSGGGKTSGSSSSKSSSAGGGNTGRGDVGAGRRGGR